MTIVRDEDVLGGEPRVEGTRIGVRHVGARVIDGGQSPAHAADQLDITLSEVYEALSYYYAHVEECVNSSGRTRTRSTEFENRR